MYSLNQEDAAEVAKCGSSSRKVEALLLSRPNSVMSSVTSRPNSVMSDNLKAHSQHPSSTPPCSSPPPAVPRLHGGHACQAVPRVPSCHGSYHNISRDAQPGRSITEADRLDGVPPQKVQSTVHVTLPLPVSSVDNFWTARQTMSPAKLDKTVDKCGGLGYFD